MFWRKYGSSWNEVYSSGTEFAPHKERHFKRFFCKENFNSKRIPETQKKHFASDRLARNQTWRRGKYSHEEGNFQTGKIVSEAFYLSSVWQQEIVGLLTYRQIKCHPSKIELFDWDLTIVWDGKYICEETARNRKSGLK